MEYTQELFRDIYWNYIESPITNAEDFKQALRTYHKSIGYKGSYPKIDWQQKVIDSPKVVIQYILLPERDNEEIRENQELLIAANGKYFTALDLLHQTHNKVGSPILGDRDNHFFEGFTYAGDQDEDYPDIPIYFLDTGS